MVNGKKLYILLLICIIPFLVDDMFMYDLRIMQIFINKIGMEYTYIIRNIVGSIILLLIVKVLLREKIMNLFTTNNKNQIIYAFLFSFFITILSLLIIIVIINIDCIEIIQNNVNTNIFKIVIASILLSISTAVFEEILFRGIIQKAFMKLISEKKGIIFTGLLFGILHIIPMSISDFRLYFQLFVYASLAGIFLGLYAFREKSLLPPIIFHAIWNLFYSCRLLQISMFDNKAVIINLKYIDEISIVNGFNHVEISIINIFIFSILIAFFLFAMRHDSKKMKITIA